MTLSRTSYSRPARRIRGAGARPRRRPPPREGLETARGLIIGLVLSIAVWALVALLAWLAIR